jgi:hypothetical protein
MLNISELDYSFAHSSSESRAMKECNTKSTSYRILSSMDALLHALPMPYVIAFSVD